MLRTPLGATSTRNTRISSRLISAALLMPVPEVAAIGLRTSGPAVPGVCATTADPIHTIATTTDDASVALSMTPPLFTFHYSLFTFYCSHSLDRASRSLIHLTNGTEVVREMRDAADDAIQLDLIDVSRRAHHTEPSGRFGTQLRDACTPFLIRNGRLAPAVAPVGRVEWIFTPAPPVHEREPIAHMIDVGGDRRACRRARGCLR